MLLVALSGKAGTGKTLLALAAALDQADRYGPVSYTHLDVYKRQE